MAVLASLLLLAGVALAANRFIDSVFDCSPPSQHDMQVQEAFLRSHVTDARGLEWTVADCDDQGEAWLEFSTALTPAAARDAFLTDPSCSPDLGPDADDQGVNCTSGDAEIYVFFEATSVAATSGELTLP